MPENRTYFAMRADEAHIAMIAAKDPGARLAHRQMKTAYQKLSSRRGAPTIERDDPLSRWANEGGAAPLAA